MSNPSLDEILSAVASHKPTVEQEAIIETAKTTNVSMMIEAMAGCTKTTTLEMMARALPLRPSLSLAFNVKIKKELEKRLPSHFNVKTMNGLGHMAWGKAIGKRVGVEEKKVYDLVKELTSEDKELSYENKTTIAGLIRKARHAGLVPEGMPYRGLIPDTWESWEDLADEFYLDLTDVVHHYAREGLKKSILYSFQGIVDYDDQIYMSALFGGAFPRYPVVMVDEAQDLSPLNHIQLQKVAGDRLIVVGDPRQAIYAFRGADSNSMGNLRSLRSEWKDHTLSLTFRCPKVIVKRQQHHAPGFTAAESNKEGQVIQWGAWNVDKLDKLEKPIAILCRNNAPLLKTALNLIRNGKGCTVLGGEIGKQLVNLSRKVLPEDNLSFEAALKKISEWENNEVIKARALEKEERIGIIRDRAACLVAVLEGCPGRNPASLRDTLVTMFQKENVNIILATGHKAKGLEWPTVIHLDPWRIPSKWAKRALEKGNPAPMVQEQNLRYVIETRTKNTLILANLEKLDGEEDGDADQTEATGEHADSRPGLPSGESGVDQD